MVTVGLRECSHCYNIRDTHAITERELVASIPKASLHHLLGRQRCLSRRATALANSARLSVKHFGIRERPPAEIQVLRLTIVKLGDVGCSVNQVLTRPLSKSNTSWNLVAGWRDGLAPRISRHGILDQGIIKTRLLRVGLEYRLRDYLGLLTSSA